MSQAPPNASKNRRFRKCLLALVLIILCIIFWKAFRPTYKGQDMQHWFDVYSRDGVREDLSKPIPPCSPAQKEALQAFQHFGEDGLHFLLERATQDSKPSQLVAAIEAFLELFPWNSRHTFELDRYYQIVTGCELLSRTGVPFEIARSFAKPYENQTDLIMATKEIMAYQWVTNNFDAMEQKIVHALEHESQGVRWTAHQALANLVRRSEWRPKDWSTMLGKKTNYNLLTQWAPESPLIKGHLISQFQSSQPQQSFKALASLATAFPESESYRGPLVDRLKTSAKQSGYGFGSNLNFLGVLRFPFHQIYTALIDLAQQSDQALIYVAVLLLDEGMDATPLLPRLEKVLESPSNKYQHAQAYLTASLFLLRQDLHHPKAWALIEQACNGSLATISSGSGRDQFIGIVQVLATHCKEAQAIMDRYPDVSKQLPMPNISAANFRLRQYRLPPFDALSSDNNTVPFHPE